MQDECLPKWKENCRNTRIIDKAMDGEPKLMIIQLGVRENTRLIKNRQEKTRFDLVLMVFCAILDVCLVICSIDAR